MQVFLASAQDVPNPVQRVVLVAAVAVDVLLDPAADFVHDAGGDLDSGPKRLPALAQPVL